MQEMTIQLIESLTDLKQLNSGKEDEDGEEDDKDQEETDEKEEDKDEEEDDDNQENEVAANSSSITMRQMSKPLGMCTISFKDVEDMIRPFDGKSNHSVEQWIVDYEELMTLLGCNELQQFLFAKKSLRGLAKLFIPSEAGVNSWSKMRRMLLKEFGARINSVELHKMLTKRKMKQNESVYEYFLTMKELANRGAIDESSLIQYVIEGIPEQPANKIMLYGAISLTDFKKKLRHYAAYRAERITHNPNQNDRAKQAGPSRKHEEAKSKEECKTERCYSCGEKGHRARECSKKELGVKCFKCNKFGHKAAACAEQVNFGAERSRRVNVINSPPTSMCKDVNINGVNVDALVDAGSDVNLIRQDVVDAAGLQTIERVEMHLTGLVGSEIKTNKSVRSIVTIDKEDYNNVVQKKEAIDEQLKSSCGYIQRSLQPVRR